MLSDRFAIADQAIHQSVPDSERALIPIIPAAAAQILLPLQDWDVDYLPGHTSKAPLAATHNNGQGKIKPSISVRNGWKP